MGVKKLILPVLMLLALQVAGQEDSTAIKQFLRANADTLAGAGMHGRGYVKDGLALAADYIKGQFKEYGLSPVGDAKSYAQEYTFPVNTFPGAMALRINGHELRPGVDYLVDAGSSSYSSAGLAVKTVDMGAIKEFGSLKKTLWKFKSNEANVLLHVDSMCKALKIDAEVLMHALPKGCYVVPQTAKLTWTTDTGEMAATVFYVREEALPKDIKDVNVAVQAVLAPKAKNENLVGEVEGEVTDTYIVFTAHYDHLGMMGDRALFPGASDNASGMSMLLYLARYFAANPQHYSMLFIAFSGEEPGLLGSYYYITHPETPLMKIKFLTNIDIMGDATDGVTVVNATEFPKQFAALGQINDLHHYIPVIKSRGKAHNSDHWYFTSAGVPSFFIYSNGGKGFYHDIFDKPNELTLNHVAGVAQLLIDFVKGME